MLRRVQRARDNEFSLREIQLVSMKYRRSAADIEPAQAASARVMRVKRELLSLQRFSVMHLINVTLFVFNPQCIVVVAPALRHVSVFVFAACCMTHRNLRSRF